MGFKFNNIHSDTFNLIVQSKSKPVLPKIRKRQLEVPGKSGYYDFGEVEKDTYENRIIELECSFKNNTIGDMRLVVRSLAYWLSGKHLLIFDDEPDKSYDAKIYSGIDFSQFYALGTFTIKFECSPFAKLLVNSGEITLADDVLLAEDFILAAQYIKEDITSETSFVINNFGTYAVQPTIEITGAFTTLTITCNSKIFVFSEAQVSGTLTINCENFTVKKGTVNKLAYASGDLDIELEVGDNTITVGGTGLNCSANVIFKALYL